MKRLLTYHPIILGRLKKIYSKMQSSILESLISLRLMDVR
jgi:hypothetical protein